VLAAVALMEKRGDPFVPSTMTLMGGPIDTRRNPTAVNPDGFIGRSFPYVIYHLSTPKVIQYGVRTLHDVAFTALTSAIEVRLTGPPR